VDVGTVAREVVAVAVGPFADGEDRVDIWTASGQKTRDGPIRGVLRGDLAVAHPQNCQVTKYYTHRHIWEYNTQMDVQIYDNVGFKCLRIGTSGRFL
jgi:hypothetical protein